MHDTGFTVTVAALLGTGGPHELLTSTQYVVVEEGETLMDAVVPPATGELFVPEGPMYHWYVNGDVPLAVTLRLVEFPCVIVVPTGCAEIPGALHVPPLTVTVAALLSVDPQPVIRTQYCVVDVGETWMEAVVPPPTGEVVVPEAPAYH